MEIHPDITFSMCAGSSFVVSKAETEFQWVIVFLIGCREKLSEVNWMRNFVSLYTDIRILLMILSRLGHSSSCKVCSNFANKLCLHERRQLTRARYIKQFIDVFYMVFRPKPQFLVHNSPWICHQPIQHKILRRSA